MRAARQADAIRDTLLLLEHPPVYTRGRRSQPGELPLGEDFYREQGIDIVDVNRGGLLTYHGPGQLVGYPIMRIADVIAFLRMIESAIVRTLADAGLSTRGRPDDGPDYTGVWAGERKIASIGVHVARGVTTHGFAINVDNDLQPFQWVVPCGLDGVRMTSVALEAAGGADEGSMRAIRAGVAERFAEAFERRPVAVTLDEVESAIAMPASDTESSPLPRYAAGIETRAVPAVEDAGMSAPSARRPSR